ncbi:LysR family transcriptional regulator [Salipaludibacillus agaradhaerens]|jgi:DNA-binding transcriptional LysR family regulator|uniref:LysR family transcriptional regulator n=1 Tax=Salipaludibacillus agaradhaerens TaxID=76935 RepID=A0A9Q4B3M8_SALAG|nr:LysR family transcriptional regulator [Salipaludibacillus agaradhaerens]MCR6097734.1 LysR family transcriptional regulator [Salipaludibacillus agaradhaerens]MCR6112782.1 LysR family transcriptional regulator [Salipaludibacillus agaradhaerens]
MNIEALQHFNKVYQMNSINSAAKELFITPQGLSKTIKQLELELEAELFDRGPRGMEPTEAGELLYARSQHIVYLMEDLKKEISIISGRKGTLNVVVTYSSTALIPVEMLYEFSDSYLGIQIKIKELPDDSSFHQMFQEDVDIGLVNDYEDIENCEHELLALGEAVVVVSHKHRLADKDEISIDDLKEEPLVVKSVGKGKDHIFVAKCLDRGFTPNVVHEFGSIITAHRMCQLNGFVAISVDFVEASLKQKDLKIIRLKEKIPQNIYLVSRKRGIQSKAIVLFKKYIKDKTDKTKSI